jgi:hypothetical protein
MIEKLCAHLVRWKSHCARVKTAPVYPPKPAQPELMKRPTIPEHHALPRNPPHYPPPDYAEGPEPDWIPPPGTEHSWDFNFGEYGWKKDEKKECQDDWTPRFRPPPWCPPQGGVAYALQGATANFVFRFLLRSVVGIILEMANKRAEIRYQKQIFVQLVNFYGFSGTWISL